MDTRIDRTLSDDGRLRSEATRLGDALHGMYRRWHRGGQLEYEGVFLNGIPDGTHRQWDEHGKLVEEFTITDGTGVQRLRIFEGFPSIAECSLVRGVPSGRERVYEIDGTVLSTRYYIEGRQVSASRYAEQSQLIDWLPKYPDLKVRARKPKAGVPRTSTNSRSKQSIPASAANLPEARQWLSTPAHILGENAAHEESIERVEAIYSAGASLVVADEFDQDQTTGEATAGLLRVFGLPDAQSLEVVKRVVEEASEVGWSIGGVGPDGELIIMLD